MGKNTQYSYFLPYGTGYVVPCPGPTRLWLERAVPVLGQAMTHGLASGQPGSFDIPEWKVTLGM